MRARPPAPGMGVGDLGEFIYVGTAKGQIYVTQDGGGGTGNDWINISTGLTARRFSRSSPIQLAAATMPSL